MFIFKVLPILLLAFLAEGTDLDKALSILACARKAIGPGVPELNIPSHYIIQLTRNLTWAGEFTVSSASFFFNNISWSGIPLWTVNATQLNDDNDTFAAFDFELKWKSLTIYGPLYGVFANRFYYEDINGYLSSLWKDTTWSGRVNITKPSLNLPGEITDLSVSWKTDQLLSDADGFGLFKDRIQTLIDHLIPSTLNSDQFSATFSEFLKNKLNTSWFSNGKIWKLVDWCNANLVAETNF